MSADLIIVVVEDNELLREEMVCFLARPGWQAHGVDCGEELNAWLRGNTPDVAVLDVNLPYEDGYSIAARLRESHPGMGIVMLTARVRHIDRSTGYQSGADVYLTKPTHTTELIAVIENLGRRLQREPVRELLLDRVRNRLIGPEGDSCSLTLSEQRLLELLAFSPNREADIDFLLCELLKSESKSATRDNLSVMISRLRSKCDQLVGVNKLVTAHRGFGYRLNMPLRLK